MRGLERTARATPAGAGRLQCLFRLALQPTSLSLAPDPRVQLLAARRYLAVSLVPWGPGPWQSTSFVLGLVLVRRHHCLLADPQDSWFFPPVLHSRRSARAVLTPQGLSPPPAARVSVQALACTPHLKAVSLALSHITLQIASFPKTGQWFWALLM